MIQIKQLTIAGDTDQSNMVYLALQDFLLALRKIDQQANGRVTFEIKDNDLLELNIINNKIVKVLDEPNKSATAN